MVQYFKIYFIPLKVRFLSKIFCFCHCNKFFKKVRKYFSYKFLYIIKYIFVFIFDSICNILLVKILLVKLLRVIKYRLFGDELILGSYVLRLYPLLISLLFFLYYEKFSKNFFLGILTLSIVVDFTVLLSGERTAFFISITKIINVYFYTKFKKNYF